MKYRPLHSGETLENTLNRIRRLAGAPSGASRLALFSLAGLTLVGLCELATRNTIELERQNMLKLTLSQVLPKGFSDPGMLKDPVSIEDPRIQGANSLTVYRLRSSGQISAYFLQAKAMGGYGGEIEFGLAIDPSWHILGVRILRHRETPGLGDLIDIQRSSWIQEFDGKSLEYPKPERWKVVKDGGDFDQFVGATITPRALVHAIRTTLEILIDHEPELVGIQNPPEQHLRPS